MFLGSDCIVRFRPANTRTKPGEITVQHGDLIGVQTGSEPTNVSLKTGSFGISKFCFCPFNEQANNIIVCIARHGGIHAGSQNQTQVKFESPLESGPVPAQIIEKPALLPEVPLADWYIGGLPLEPSQPTIVLPPFRAERPKPVWAPNGDATNGEGGEENSQENNEEQAANQNIIILTTPPPTPRLREPRGLSPLAGYGESTASLRRSLAVPSPPPVTAKRVGKATRGRASTGSSVPDDRRSSTPMRGGKRASIGKRKAKAEPGASDAEAEDEMSNSGEPKEEDGEGGGKRRKNVGGRRSLGTPTTTRGRGGGRGRGGRKSAVV